MPTPLQIIKEQHGSKAALIDKIVPLVERPDGESEADQKKRLAHTANKKLLSLLALGQRVEQLGGRDKIVARILELKAQPKDHEYADSLGKLSLGRLVDALGTVEHRATGKAKRPPKKHRRKRG